MQEQFEKLLNQPMSRKKFLATLGLGLVGVLGFGSVMRMLEGKASAQEAGSQEGASGSSGAVMPAQDRDHNKRPRLIQGGYLLTMDGSLGDIEGGDILVDKGKIVKIGRNLRSHGAEVIDARNMIVIPGFIDNHRHAWESVVRGIATGFTFGQYFQRVLLGTGVRATPRDIYLGTILSAYDALNAGITTMLDWANAAKTREHAIAGVDALRDSGIRGIYAYGPPSSSVSGPHPVSQADIDAVAQHIARYPMLRMAIGTNSPELRPGTEDRFATDIARARALGVPIIMHSGFSGGTGPSIVQQLHDQGLLAGDMTFLHANKLSLEDFQRIAAVGAHVSSSPPVELQMGFGVPPLGRMLAAGVHPTMSIDIPTGASNDMFDQLRMLLQVERSEQWRAGPQSSLSLYARDVLPYATTNAAESVQMQDLIGSLTPGKQADIVLVRANGPSTFLAKPHEALVHYAGPTDVDTVLIAGRIMKRHGQLLGIDLRNIQQEARAANQRLLAP